MASYLSETCCLKGNAPIDKGVFSLDTGLQEVELYAMNYVLTGCYM